MTIKEAAERLGCSQLFLREWIASGTCPFGTAVRINGNKKRTFLIVAERMERYIHGTDGGDENV